MAKVDCEGSEVLRGIVRGFKGLRVRLRKLGAQFLESLINCPDDETSCIVRFMVASKSGHDIDPKLPEC